ncbi:MAG: glycosyltransferase, partial [Myxococcota bacterium]|nr:glycosyltransferase [Myxococcota bacterium]
MVQTRVLVARRVREDFAANDGYRSMLSFYQKVIHPDASGVGPIMIREKEELHTRKRARTALGIPVEATVLYLSLGGGGDVNAADLLPKMVRALLEKDFYIVVGAGPLYQGEEIRGDKIRWMTRYVPLELMQGFDLAISAGGYNSFHELMYAQVPTIFFPQSRIADDQKERVMRAVKAGAGKYASNWQEAVSMTDHPGSRMACSSLVESNGAKRAAIEILSTHIS